MSVNLVRSWLDAGELDLPLPASGNTARRWRKLMALAEIDVAAGRLAEAHADAVAILAELGGHPAAPGQWWGVWAAEAPHAVVTAREDGDGRVRLDGTKAWCSGAGICTDALITARCGDRTMRDDRHRHRGGQGIERTAHDAAFSLAGV